jgi:hypothetical protein
MKLNKNSPIKHAGYLFLLELLCSLLFNQEDFSVGE